MDKLQAVSILLIAVISLSLTGCGDRAARMDRRDLGHPLVKRALELKEEGRVEKAAELLQRALDERPSLARAHLELGILYDTPYGDDFVRAIYHYQRYLEKRPQTEKRDIIEGLIIGARLSFATTLPNQPSGAVDMIAKLRRENEILRKRVRGLEAHLKDSAVDAELETAVPAAEGPVEKVAPDPIKAVRAPAEAPRYYQVRKNDTLTRIAQKVYGDPGKWRMLYEENKDTLDGPEKLRLGQKIRIPDLNE